MDDLNEWLLITDDDIHLAHRLWLRALDDDRVPQPRVAQLHDDLGRLIHTQAQQEAERFRATHQRPTEVPPPDAA